jgi:hypothetical protein
MIMTDHDNGYLNEMCYFMHHARPFQRGIHTETPRSDAEKWNQTSIHQKEKEFQRALVVLEHLSLKFEIAQNYYNNVYVHHYFRSFEALRKLKVGKGDSHKCN